MGDEAEALGFYELGDYNPYEYDESKGFTVWTQRDSTEILVSQMSNRHIQNAIRICRTQSECANFSCDSDLWNDWIDVFNSVLSERARKGTFVPTINTQPRPKNKPKKSKKNPFLNMTFTASSVTLKCHCGTNYQARVADLKRGWALSCSKRCAAIKRDYGRPNPTIV